MPFQKGEERGEEKGGEIQHCANCPYFASLSLYFRIGEEGELAAVRIDRSISEGGGGENEAADYSLATQYSLPIDR